jgi:four helix bundle protein
MQDFHQLDVWRKSHRLTLLIYEATRGFPAEERYGLVSQMRRAAASIPANIAEGCCRGSKAEFKQFLHVAMGSASELEYHVLLAHDLRLLDATQYKELTGLVSEIKKMLAGLIRTLKAVKEAPGH